MSKYFADWVSYETICREAGFNYWESGIAFSKKNRDYITYITRDKEDKKNIVVIEKLSFPEMLVLPKTPHLGKSKKEWFFGIIDGKPLSDCNKEEQEEFYKELEKLAGRKHRVAGRDLESLILKNL